MECRRIRAEGRMGRSNRSYSFTDWWIGGVHTLFRRGIVADLDRLHRMSRNVSPGFVMWRDICTAVLIPCHDCITSPFLFDLPL
jgi:hypothetical protein